MNAIPIGLLLQAIEDTETGHLPQKERSKAVGDGGRSIGPLQIGRACWKDAMELLFHWEPEKLSPNYRRPPYRMVKNPTFAQVIFFLYMKRYAPSCLKTMTVEDAVEMARIWNGGPWGAEKKSTIPYAQKFLTKLEKLVDDETRTTITAIRSNYV